MNARAAKIISDAQQEFNNYARFLPSLITLEAYPAQIGRLNAAIHDLCSELDPMTFKRNPALEYLEVPCASIGVAFVVGFEYARAVPARLSGPPEDCTEGEPERLEVFEVRLAGIDITQVLKSTVLDDIEEATLALIHDIQEEEKKEA